MNNIQNKKKKKKKKKKKEEREIYISKVLALILITGEPALTSRKGSSKHSFICT